MLYSYKMTHDSGFAPNPFFGIMTLATCKWMIREKKNPDFDDNLYLAGFTSHELCGEKVGEERLIYIMKVTEKLTFDEYYNEPRFQCKKPSDDSLESKSGDNIYFLDGDIYHQDNNQSHDNCGDMIEDLKSKFVLISNDFYYFGSGAIPIDNLGINIPRYQSGNGVKSKNFEKLLDHLRLRDYKKNIPLNPPHSWI